MIRPPIKRTKKTYTFWQTLRASLCQENVEWHYATEVERMVMRFNSLSKEDKKTFLEEIEWKSSEKK
jgi:hypothetical protein